MALLFPIANKKKLVWIDDTGRIVHTTKTKAKLHVAHYEGGVDEDAIEPVEIAGSWGFARVSGVVVEPTWALAGRFSDGLGAVARYFGEGYRQGSVYRWGYVDDTGAVVIEPAFLSAGTFRDGVAFAQIPDADDPKSLYGSRGWGTIDRSGDFVVSPRFDSVHEGPVLSRFCVDGKWGHLDRRGEVVVEARYDAVGQLADGVARVMRSTSSGPPPGANDQGMLVITPSFHGLMGLVDEQGREIVPCTVPAPSLHVTDEDSDFSDGLARYETDQGFGYWNTAGDIAIEARFADCSRFSEGRGAVQDGKRWGYIDTSGEMVIAPAFEYARPFSEGRAAVQSKVSMLDPKSGKKRRRARWGFIDRDGTEVIPPVFKQVSSFHDGLALVTTEEDDWAYIRPDGERIYQGR